VIERLIMRIETQIANAEPKPRVGVYKFTSCDGCQLSFLNAGEQLVQLADMVEFVHFAEMGPVAPDALVDIAFVEGSVSTHDEQQRIKRIREQSRYLITIGACATAGGLQALRNMQDAGQWLADIYAQPDVLDSLDTSTAISENVRVDLELWGCPVNTGQVVTAIRSLMFGVAPQEQVEAVCLECKRQHQTCVLVAQGQPCMGPVTRTGCGAICPRHGRDCYACYGPAENANTEALGRRLAGLGLVDESVAQRFRFINNHAPVFEQAGKRWQPDHD
jgi:sulfhydrogenase subunit delta